MIASGERNEIEMADLNEYATNSNGPAYTKNELRNGPSLEYIGVKMQCALEVQHGVLAAIATSRLKAYSSEGTSLEPTQVDQLLDSVCESFYYQLIAFLALYNMLSMASTSNLVEKLRAMEEVEFSAWLAFVSREGSVVGIEN